MRHLFFTRIAVEMSSYPVQPPEKLRPQVELWLNKSRQFYEHQTIDRPVKVILRYSPRYENMLNEYEWPDYARLTQKHPNQSAFDEIQAGDKVSLTRVDADDSYSVDFLEMIEQLEREQNEQRSLVLHKQMRQQEIKTGGVTKPMKHRSPMFSSIIFSSIPDDITPETHAPYADNTNGQFIGIVGDHGKYQYEPHITSPGCYSLMRITGRNFQNKMGLMGREYCNVEWETEPLTRFVGL